MKYFSHEISFFCLYISSTFSNLSPLCSSHSSYLCFWQLAASVHSIRVQRPVTKTFCRGTTGHPECSYWHEWPEPGGAIQIRKGITLLLLLWQEFHPSNLLAYVIELWWNENFLGSDFFMVKDITTSVEKEWTVSFLFSNDLLYFLCKVFNSKYFLSWIRNFLMLNSSHFETFCNSYHPWSIKILPGELPSYP